MQVMGRIAAGSLKEAPGLGIRVQGAVVKAFGHDAEGQDSIA
jgi:hypothetical protein